MGRKTVFSQLPKELTDLFHQLLQSDSLTQKQVAERLNEYLQELGQQPVITRDIVQKQSKNYKERLAVAIERKRREREIVSSYMEAFSKEPNTDNLQLIGMIVESAVTRVAFEVDEDDAPSIKDLKDLAQTRRILADTSRITEDIIKKAQEAMAQRVAEEMKAQGIDEEKITVIERVIIGKSASSD